MGARYKNLCGFLIVIAIIVVLLSYYYQINIHLLF